MIVRRFLAWVRVAPACARADATSALARAFLFSDMDEADRYEAGIALTVMLDDPSPLVHRALAEALASAAEAPRHLVTGLVALGGEAAALILRRTRLLSDAELVDAAAIGGERAQTAIAEREELSAAVAAAIAEVGALSACIALTENVSAAPTESALLRVLQRFGHEAGLREALLARQDLPARVRERLMTLVSKLLKDFTVERGWLDAQRAEAITRDAAQRGALSLARDVRLDLGAVVECLREGGRLTPAFVVHALLVGEVDLVAACLADLGRAQPARVAAFLREERQAPLTALLKRAGIPHWLAPVFPMALRELRAAEILAAGATASTPLRLAARRILARLEAEGGPDSLRLIAFLRGLEADAARDEARAIAAALITLDEEETASQNLMLEERRARALRPSLDLVAIEAPRFDDAGAVPQAQNDEAGLRAPGLDDDASATQIEAVAVSRAA